MTAQIKQYPIFNENAGSLAESTRNNQMTEFSTLLETITKSKNEHDLRVALSQLPKFEHFEFGFGANHFWVHQVIDGKTQPERLIFVDFSNEKTHPLFKDFYYEMNHRMNSRLQNACRAIDRKNPGMLLKNATLVGFLRIRQAGEKTFNDFAKLRTEYLNR